MKKKEDPYKTIRDSLTQKQMSFFFGLNLDRNKVNSVKSIGQEYFTADVYTYKVLQKLSKLGLIDVTKGKKELHVEVTEFGNSFIREGNYKIIHKESST
jgi:predicted transcriptional regulator